MTPILSLPDLEETLGNSIRSLRLLKNWDRQTLCDRAGVSLNALKNLENAKGSTVKTLLLVVRSLGRLDWVSALAPQITVNPLHMVRNKPQRTRASRQTRNNEKDT